METGQNDVSVPQHHLITFYDAVDVDKIPETAMYAALYADGEFAVKPGVDIRRFMHRRWITITGMNHHCGIADYEYPNPTFTNPGRLEAWADGRNKLYPGTAIVYHDLADTGRALRALGSEAAYHWIATRKRGPLTPEQISSLLHFEYKVELPPEHIWAHQYDDVNGEYDVSNLFLEWYL